MLNRLLELLESAGKSAEATPSDTAVKLTECVRLVGGPQPVKLRIGDADLCLFPDRRLDRTGTPSEDWILVDPERFGREISGSARIKSGESLLVGRSNEAAARLFGFNASVAPRQLRVTNNGGELTLTPLDKSTETLFSALGDCEATYDPIAVRKRNLDHLRTLYRGTIGLMPANEALATLEQVNALLTWENRRQKDSAGRPGGLLSMSPDQTPIIVGDLHGRVENLLRILSEDAFLDAIERGTAYLLFLGDTIHPDEDDELEQMDSSILILDIIFKLMARFPDNVFYVRGNHESFEKDVAKGGVLQGVLFRQRVRTLRGERYARALERFFENLPYVAVSDDFAACHGGPVRTAERREDIVEIKNREGLAHALTWTRPRRPGGYTGFTRRDVEAFRSNLDLPPNANVIVAHTPLTHDESFWVNANGIPDHHIIYSAHRNSVGVFVRLGGMLMPLDYPSEPLLDFANRASGEIEAASQTTRIVGAA